MTKTTFGIQDHGKRSEDCKFAKRKLPEKLYGFQRVNPRDFQTNICRMASAAKYSLCVVHGLKPANPPLFHGKKNDTNKSPGKGIRPLKYMGQKLAMFASTKTAIASIILIV